MVTRDSFPEVTGSTYFFMYHVWTGRPGPGSLHCIYMWIKYDISEQRNSWFLGNKLFWSIVDVNLYFLSVSSDRFYLLSVGLQPPWPSLSLRSQEHYSQATDWPFISFLKSSQLPGEYTTCAAKHVAQQAIKINHKNHLYRFQFSPGWKEVIIVKCRDSNPHQWFCREISRVCWSTPLGDIYMSLSAATATTTAAAATTATTKQQQRRRRRQKQRQQQQQQQRQRQRYRRQQQ